MNGDRGETPRADHVSKSRLFREFGILTCLPPSRPRYFTGDSLDCKRPRPFPRPTAGSAYHDEMHAAVESGSEGWSGVPVSDQAPRPVEAVGKVHWTAEPLVLRSK